MFGTTIALPVILAPYLCLTDTVSKGHIMCTVLFVSGIITLLQTTFGSRLPIVQGGSYSFLPPIIAILTSEKWQCSSHESLKSSNFTSNITLSTEWYPRMREIQGALMLSSVVGIILGITGLIGFIIRFIGPLTITPTICMVGLSLFETAADFAAKHWGIAILTMSLVIIFSQYLSWVKIPCFYYRLGTGCSMAKIELFKMFPVLLSILLVWLFCFILTATNVFPTDKNKYGYYARTDLQISVLQKSNWIIFPYPGQWGVPTVSAEGFVGMLVVIFICIVESIGDMFACARLSGAPSPPSHAVNRGLTIEGFGCFLAGAWGSGVGTTSYSENIGAIGITRVGSRRVIQFAAGFMIIFGMFGKFGALFVTIPDPIIGGVFCIVFGMVTAVGLSNLQYANLNSSRNLLILGFSLLMGLVVPNWMKRNSNAIQTGSKDFDQIATILLKTNMFIAGLLGFLLDNTIPGTDDERGMTKWRNQVNVYEPEKEEAEAVLKTDCYNLPFGMNFIKSHKYFSYLPFCPTYQSNLPTKEKQNSFENRGFESKL